MARKATKATRKQPKRNSTLSAIGSPIQSSKKRNRVSLVLEGEASVITTIVEHRSIAEAESEASILSAFVDGGTDLDIRETGVASTNVDHLSDVSCEATNVDHECEVGVFWTNMDHGKEGSEAGVDQTTVEQPTKKKNSKRSEAGVDNQTTVDRIQGGSEAGTTVEQPTKKKKKRMSEAGVDKKTTVDRILVDGSEAGVEQTTVEEPIKKKKSRRSKAGVTTTVDRNQLDGSEAGVGKTTTVE